jgi:TolA-binding protein
VHTGSSHWELVSGPLTVRVTGTRFDLNWNPVTQLFSLHVLEGSVAVSGPVAGPERPVRGGETLLVSVPEQRLELSRGGIELHRSPEQPSKNVSPGSTATAGPAAPSSSPHVLRPSADETSLVRKSEPVAWRELAARGALREAFAAAEASGYREACQSASASELLLLGDAARLAGRPDRVSEALLSLRQRYPGDSRRAAAAFMLGKVAFDQQRAFAQAASWFATCLREQPGGSLSREASGRLIEALRAAGDTAAAERAAREYLVRYPQGPHAPLARSLLP